jgi:hypothetical protein
MPFAKESKNAIKNLKKAVTTLFKESKKNYDGLNKSTKFKKSFSNPSAEIGEISDSFKTLGNRVLKDSAPAPSTPRSATPTK